MERRRLDDPGWFHECQYAFQRARDASVIAPVYRDAFRLVTHPNAGLVRLLPGRGFVFTDPETGETRTLDGLTKPLELFHPCPLNVPTGGARTGGAGRGVRADREITDLVNKGVEPEGGTYAPHAARTLDYLRENSLQPFAAQFVVWDPHLCMATPLDILCVDLAADTEHNIVSVQLKTGFERNRDRPNGHLIAPHPRVAGGAALEAQPDSYATRHQLQVLVEHIMLNKNFDNLALRSVCLTVSQAAIAQHGIAPAFRRLHRVVFDTLRRRHSPRIDHAANIARALAARATRRRLRGGRGPPTPPRFAR